MIRNNADPSDLFDHSTAYELPPLGDNPSSVAAGTTPGSFAQRGRVGTAWAFASPDTPGMPQPSDKTAWDFLPDEWATSVDADTDPDERAGADVGGCANGAPVAHHAAPVSHQGGTVADHGAGGASNSAPGAVKRGEGASDSSTVLANVRFAQSDGTTRTVSYPCAFSPITQLESARLGVITPQMKRVAEREPHLTPGQVRDEVAAGRMVIPANVNHLAHNLDPMAIGRASKTKVNANMGASPVASNIDDEVEKLRWAERWQADTVMDLSTGGDLNATRQAIIDHATVPIGTVPIYSMIIGKRIEDLAWPAIEAELHNQARQGVDYFTIHAGVRKAHLPLVRDRLIGIVSRGGSLLAKWMITHNRENIMYDRWEDICRILRAHDVTFSIGDGLRPGGLADATDAAQLAELVTLGELTERAWRQGVQVMVEGPGHVPFDQIEFNMKLQRRLCHGAPFYVLGPLVTDIFPGYDHITSCIGATAAGYHGASMLCYVTPKEHLGLPKKDDVKQGCVAYKIAAHAADVALGIPNTRDRDDELTRARAALNWQKHFDLSFDPDIARAYHDEDLTVDTDFCAMCGHDWCSVRISKEIQEFTSGKADGYVPDKVAQPSPGVSDAGAESLRQRGVLTQEEIHKLAHKGKKAVCHSDVVAEPETAKLVQLNTLKAHGVAVNEIGL